MNFAIRLCIVITPPPPFVFIALKIRIVMNKSNLLNKYFNSMLTDAIVIFFSIHRSSYDRFFTLGLSFVSWKFNTPFCSSLIWINWLFFFQLSWNNNARMLQARSTYKDYCISDILGCEILMCVVFHNCLCLL